MIESMVNAWKVPTMLSLARTIVLVGDIVSIPPTRLGLNPLPGCAVPCVKHGFQDYCRSASGITVSAQSIDSFMSQCWLQQDDVWHAICAVSMATMDTPGKIHEFIHTKTKEPHAVSVKEVMKELNEYGVDWDNVESEVRVRCTYLDMLLT
jgi:hypothetical protein